MKNRTDTHSVQHGCPWWALKKTWPSSRFKGGPIGRNYWYRPFPSETSGFRAVSILQNEEK